MPGQEYFAGTHFNPQITWWDESTAFIDYMRRCQFLTQQGGFQADVLHYYGDHIPNIFGRKGHDPAGALLGHDYDVLSEELLLEQLSFADGKLRLPSGMSYELLTLPDHRVLSLGALRKIDSLARAGARILGPKPLKAVSLVGGEAGRAEFQHLADGVWGTENSEKGIRSVGKGRVAWGMTATEFLASEGIAPDLIISLPDGKSATGTDWIHYRIGEADVYFLAELDGKARDVVASFRVAGRVPELWNPVDGSIRHASRYTHADGRTKVPLKLGEFDSLFVVFREPSASDRDDDPNFTTWQEMRIVKEPWEVSFDPKWGGPEKPVRFETLTDWTNHAEPGIKNYSGKAVYRTEFHLDKDLLGETLGLELGQVEGVGIARVTLNGSDLGIVWRPPFRVDINQALKPGKNELEVMVVNSWRNRLMADHLLPENERFTKTNIVVVESGGKKWIPEPSGLLGPVRIVEMK